MKRLSLLVVALTILMTASGCCCGWHGCNSCPSSCGYGYAPQPACGSCGSCGGGGCGYAPPPVYGGAPACPTCPNGGCGVQGPVGYLDGGYIHASTTSPATAGTASVAATDNLPTF